MKIISYNLGYGRGHDGSVRDYLFKVHHFLRQDVALQKKVLGPVIDMLHEEKPDLFTYAEASTGSFRNRNFDQHQYLTEVPRLVVADLASSKYGKSFLKQVPYHVGNSNGVISFQKAEIQDHYLNKSRKKLVLEVSMEGLTVFTVHLPLTIRHRRAHLKELASMINEREGDVIVCGDFNILRGLDELSFLIKETSLQVAGEGVVTHPAHKPKRQLDVFLYRFEDKTISPYLRTINVAASDHLPVLLEW